MVYEPYNLSIISNNSTGIVGLMQTVNSELLFGTLGAMILLTILVISMMAFYSSSGNVIKSISASLYLCFSISLILFLLGLVNELVVFGAIILAGLSTAIAIFSK